MTCSYVVTLAARMPRSLAYEDLNSCHFDKFNRFALWTLILWMIGTIAPSQSSGQARTTANQGKPAAYGWKDPDGAADGVNSISFATATADSTMVAASRLYNIAGDPVADANLPADNSNFTLTFKLVVSTPTLPPNNHSTITAYLTTEYSINGGGSWFAVGGTSQVSVTGTTPGVFTNTQSFTPTLTFSGGQPVWIRLILRGTSSGTLSGGIAKVQVFASTGWTTDPYAITWSHVSGPPVVDVSPYNFDKQDYSRCAHACFAATYAQSTVPYFSLDAPRSVTLAYNGDRVYPRVFVHVNVRPDPYYAGTPTQYNLQVKVNGALVTFVNGEQTLHFAYPGDTGRVRLGGEFNDSAQTTIVYPMDIIVTAVYGSSSFTRDVSTNLAVVNEANSPIARGWTLPGIQKLYLQADGSALITEGDGSAVYFKKQSSIFVTPAGEFSSLIAVGSTWVRSYADSAKVTFDNTGKMTSVKDRFSNQTTITYDGSNRVWKITDPMNRVITLTYGTNGLSSILDPGNRTTNVIVNSGHSLTTITDPDNLSTSFGYDTRGRLRTVTNRGQRVSTFGYDSLSGKLDSLIAPQVGVYENGSISNVVPVVVQIPWQKAGVPFGSTGTPVAAPKADTVKATVTEAGGAITRFTVNHWGTPVQITDPLGRTTTASFEASGLTIRTVYPSGGVDSSVYGSNGLPIFVQFSDTTNRRRFRYAGWGQVDSAWGGPLSGMRMFIGVNGRTDSMRVADSTVRHSVFDAHGRLVSDTDGYHNLIGAHWFSALTGNQIKDSLPGGLTETIYPDTFGRDTAIIVATMPTRRKHYDQMNQELQVFDGVYTTPTAATYDSMGHVISVTDEKGQVYRSAYNALGWLTLRTDPVGNSDTLLYNRDGDLVRHVNRRGQAMIFAYDPIHRDTSRTGSNTESDRWTFSTNGRVITAISPVASETTFANVRGLPDSVKTILGGQVFVQHYAYTNIGLLDSMYISNGLIAFRSRKYTYDPKKLTILGIRLGSSAGTTSLTADRNYHSTKTTFRSGELEDRVYNELGALAAIGANAAYTDSTGRVIALDVLGRIILQANDSIKRAHQFTYDGLGRLVSDSIMISQGIPPGCQGFPPPLKGSNGENCAQAQGWTAASGVTFGYDTVGNRLDQSGSYNTGNRIQSFAGCTYSTDPDGDVTSRSCSGQNITFKWTAESHLDTVAIAGGPTIVYYYDANGRLVRRDSAGGPQRFFLWEGLSLLAELNSTATAEIAEYSYYPGLDSPHAIVVGGIEYDMHEDALGDVVAVTDSANKAVKRSYNYDAWGNLGAGSSDNLPFNGSDRVRWKGALWIGNEANIYYMRNRWYDPGTGRFLSEDPAGLNSGINPMTFGFDDPVNTSDPSGEATCPPGYKPTGRTSEVTVNGQTEYVIECKNPNGGGTILVQTAQNPNRYAGDPTGEGKHPVFWGDDGGVGSALPPSARRFGGTPDDPELGIMDLMPPDDGTPSCVGIFFESWAENMNPMEPDPPSEVAEQATHAYATYRFNGALAYAATKGLTYPFRSSVFRNLLSVSEGLAEVAPYLGVVFAEIGALATEIDAAKKGECE